MIFEIAICDTAGFILDSLMIKSYKKFPVGDFERTGGGPVSHWENPVSFHPNP
jgi:hypothetical protein